MAEETPPSESGALPPEGRVEAGPASTPRSWTAVGLKLSIAYLVACTLTLPLAAAIWLGELPLLALVHLPKLLVFERIHRWGSDLVRDFAPGTSTAAVKPYTLALTYLLGLSLVLGSAWITTRLRSPHSRLALFLLLAAVVDYGVSMLWDGRSVSLY